MQPTSRLGRNPYTAVALVTVKPECPYVVSYRHFHAMFYTDRLSGHHKDFCKLVDFIGTEVRNFSEV